MIKKFNIDELNTDYESNLKLNCGVYLEFFCNTIEKYPLDKERGSDSAKRHSPFFLNWFTTKM